jgi:predicted regulator of Ras-like GTPase activity (Roadblock/LC7/MglB family)
MADIETSLQELMEIKGTVGTAIVDYNSGMTLGTKGGGDFDMELAAAGKTEVVRSERAMNDNLGTDESIDDILITLDDHYHLIKMFRTGDIFTLLVLDKDNANLGLARRLMDQIDSELEIQ